MIAGEGGAGPFPYGAEEWRVRLRCRGRSGVLGAGVLLDSEHVLTCAHVALAAEDLTVEMVGLPGTPVSAASIIASVEPQEQCGDVAILRLATPQRGVQYATLRKVALTWNRAVHTQGYPHRLEEQGAWATMTLSGMSGTGWQQMNQRPGGPRVQRGFSGAAVADDENGHVLGIVVSEYTDGDVGLSWMIPVKAIQDDLPMLSRWVVGDDGIDATFVPPRDSHYSDYSSDRVREMTDWIARRQDGGAVLIIVGDDLENLRHAIGLSTVGETPQPDLAIDAEGLSAEQVAQRIVDRAGMVSHVTSVERLQEGTPPMTVVIDGVDVAREPRALLDEVCRPMVESGARLVLGFRRHDVATVAAARALGAAAVTARLDDLAGRVAALLAAAPDSTATRLRIGVSALRRAAAGDWQLVAEKLPRFDRAVARAEHQRALTAQTKEARSDLRGRLEVARYRAAAGGHAEHADLHTRYRRADAALSADPIDLGVAKALVRDYEAAVRDMLGGGGRA